jgi:hypothetical protein
MDGTSAGVLNSKSHLSGQVELATGSMISVDQTASKTTSTDGTNAGDDSAAFAPATQTINGTLSAGSNNLLSLKTHFDPNFTHTDKLLIKGEVITNTPINVQVTLSGSSFFTDTDNDGAADNQEGVSLIQVAGKATSL